MITKHFKEVFVFYTMMAILSFTKTKTPFGIVLGHLLKCVQGIVTMICPVV